MLEVDEASLAKENAFRKGQIDSMVEESKIEEEVSSFYHTPDIQPYQKYSGALLTHICYIYQADKKRNLDEVDEVYDRDVSILQNRKTLLIGLSVCLG